MKTAPNFKDALMGLVRGDADGKKIFEDFIKRPPEEPDHQEFEAKAPRPRMPDEKAELEFA